jgi:anti-sigma B factor antagonist
MFEAPRRRVLVDLKGIAYISSAGFRALLIANKAAADSTGTLALCGVEGEVARLFEIGAFTDLFLICPTRADGIAKLQQS